MGIFDWLRNYYVSSKELCFVVLVAAVTVDAVGVAVIQGLLYLLPQHGGSHQILSRWQPATNEMCCLIFCNSTYFLEHCFRNCGSCTTAGTQRIVYRYVTLIRYRGIRKNSSLKRQYITSHIYLLILSAAGVIIQLTAAVSQRFQFIFLILIQQISVLLKLM